MKDHDRLALAKNQMERRLRERRASSKLPDLVEMVLSRPLVSTGMIQATLKVSKQGALNLVGELHLREMTGRGRFRAWGIV
ncbi:helix-turn-helix domain-containing protein [Aminobacter carboxidus]|uniref:helix-turn-helix domain-containing protein n=1 Tax=Aminobacter carboxidus TaxID=376165 RepID=UPI0031B60E06